MIPKEIIKNYNLDDYIDGWLMGFIELPNRSFYNFFKENNGIIYNTTIQNYDNIENINLFLKEVDKHMKNENITLKKLYKTRLSSIENFDNIIFAPFEYTLIPNSNFPDFDKRLIYIYPIYDFELTGEESKKDLKAITRRVLSTTEWNREQSPLVRYKFTNPKHQYGTIGKNLVIDKEVNVYSALSKFETNDCLMEVQNSIKEELTITYVKDKLKYKINGVGSSYIDFDKLEIFLKEFFRRK